MTAPLLEVEDLRRHFRVRPSPFSRAVGAVRAVDGVSFRLRAGETLGLVGESGCGKSTVAKLVARLLEPDGGAVRLDGQDLLALEGAALRRARAGLGVVFQDPAGALNPRHRVERIVGEPLEIHGRGSRAERRAAVADLLERVGLRPEAMARHPHEFSGGQRQRIGIARALALRPRLVVLDEAVSALDVSVGAQVVNLLRRLQRDLGLAYLFIAHDLAVVRHISDRVAVMYLGRIVETAAADDLFGRPHHPYTQSLLSAVPRPVPGGRGRRVVLRGEVPSPLAVPAGCRFHPRCPLAFDACRVEDPAPRDPGDGRLVACHLVRPGAPPPDIRSAA